MRLRVTLLCVDEVRELGGVTDEEHRRIVVHPVPVAFLRPQLNRESTRVTRSIRRTALATNGGESDSCASLIADFAEELRTGEVRDVMRDLEVSVCASTLGMHDTLRDTLAVKVSKEVNVVEVWVTFVVRHCETCKFDADSPWRRSGPI